MILHPCRERSSVSSRLFESRQTGPDRTVRQVSSVLSFVLSGLIQGWSVGPELLRVEVVCNGRSVRLAVKRRGGGTNFYEGGPLPSGDLPAVEGEVLCDLGVVPSVLLYPASA